MIKLSKKFLAINLGAGTVIVAALISFLHTTFTRPNVPVCTARYTHQMRFALDRETGAATPADIQAAANGHDEGILENLTIAQFSEGPSHYAMGVKIASGTVEQHSERGTPGGISLPWAPTLLEQPSAACLSYDVFLPADFDFGGGGTLPGLFGGALEQTAKDAPRFSINMAWHPGGAPKLYVETRSAEYERSGAFPTYMRALPRGKWLHIDQELIINTVQGSDGIARLWIDGQIESDVKGAWFRDEKNIAITGVAGEVYFGGSGTKGSATADTTIWISPFVLRWNS